MSYVIQLARVKIGEALPCHPNHIIRVEPDPEVRFGLCVLYWEHEGPDISSEHTA